ncbi:MAG: hypothetical protein CMQ38_11410 [Gammaproteobacteria bacterium]|nr:hypothetical protein [Gammaproteobacteria bacterium]
MKISLTHSTFKNEKAQIAILLSLLLIFSFNLTGLLEFGTPGFPGFRFTPNSFQAEVLATVDFYILLLFAALMALVLPILRPIAASSLIVFVSLPLLFMGLREPYASTAVPFQYSLLVILVLYGMNVLLTYFSETQKKQKLINIFSRYVPPDIVDEVSKHPELIDLTGQLKPLSIMFCDLKDFTGISEQLSPKQLVSMLNEYFTTLSAILYQHGATIDKYIGDSIMAFWGAPIPHEDHAQRSILAAMDMHKTLTELKQLLTSKGLPSTDMGIGINTGMVNVGNMGSAYRLNYTVIGDAVNLAARLERLTRVYNIPTIVGQETKDATQGIVFRELDTLVVKGRSEQVRIYQPLCLEEDLTESQASSLETHVKAMECYYARDYEKAEMLFKQLSSETEAQSYYRHMVEKTAFSKSI